MYITLLNKWTLKKNYTDNGFYIRTNTVPNTSRTKGLIVSNLEIFIPKLFKFLEGDQTPLDIFGFKNSYYNNIFSYYKNNFTNINEIDIKYSYVINNDTDCKQYLILETLNVDNFNIDDEVYVENHTTTLRDIDYKKNILFKCNNITSFADFICKFRDIYNNQNNTQMLYENTRQKSLKTDTDTLEIHHENNGHFKLQ